MGIERGADLDRALAIWGRDLGEDRVIAGSALAAYGESTLAETPQPAAAIKVGSADEVVTAVRTANECAVPLYPISRGKNWGYGDACPAAPGQVILDLSAMDRIVEVDPDLAYAVVEPGVTQQQLHDHLEREGYPLWFPCTASAPDTSVIGNLVERGVGSTPYSDHAAHACDMEVVLGDGTLIETGLGRYPGARARNTYRWGVGPHLDGLFAQSNLGIVVRAAVWLMPRSEEVVAFTLTMQRDEQIAEVTERLRKLRLEGTLRAPVFIENGYRALANRGAYPWAAMRDATPLPPKAVPRLLGASPIAAVNGPWNAFGSIYGTKRAVRAAMLDTKEGLAGLGTLRFTSEARLGRTERLGRVMGALRLRRGKQLAAMAQVARAGMQTLKGVPSAAGMSVSRWRLRRDASGLCEDPTAEGCGLYWLAPVCPAKGAEVRRCTELIEREMLAAGFEPLIRVAFTGDRAVFVTTLLCFDRDDSEQAGRADRLHRELTALLLEEGYPPYRSAITTMGLLDPDGSSYWSTVEALREALDPNRVIAPGRYEPGAAFERAEPGPVELDGQKGLKV